MRLKKDRDFIDERDIFAGRFDGQKNAWNIWRSAVKPDFDLGFWEANSKVYKIQHKLSNGTIADAMLFAPEPMGNICIDSKFPLENFRRIMTKI